MTPKSFFPRIPHSCARESLVQVQSFWRRMGVEMASRVPGWPLPGAPELCPLWLDRPLTTSTAHEEGHSRPVLQHCTFAQPYIPEEEEPCKMPQEGPGGQSLRTSLRWQGKLLLPWKQGRRSARRMTPPVSACLTLTAISLIWVSFKFLSDLSSCRGLLSFIH